MKESNALMKVGKSLKRFLKKKVACTASLVTAFLITGSIGMASTADIEMQVAESTTAFLASIEAQRAELEELLKSNKSRLRELTDTYGELVRQGDWYSKLWQPSVFVGGSFWYDKDDSQDRHGVTSNREDTPMDAMRAAYREAARAAALKAGGAATPAGIGIVPAATSGSGTSYVSSGWLLNTDTWNTYSKVYDNESQVTIKPTLTIAVVSTPSEPEVKFDTPKAPDDITPPDVDPPSISTININVAAPGVNPPNITPVELPNMDVQVTDQQVTVTISKIDVNMSTTSPEFTLNPSVPPITISPATVTPVSTPSVTLPDKTVTPPTPNANPFTDYGFGSGGADVVYGNGSRSNIVAYAGTDTSGNLQNIAGGTGTTNKNGVKNIIYINNGTITNATLHIAGVKDGAGYSLSSGKKGTIGIHALNLNTISNTTANLYGRAVFLSSEAWRAGQNTLTDVTVNIKGDDNAVFYLFPGTVSNMMSSGQYVADRQAFIKGKVDVTASTKNNIVILQSGMNSAMLVDNSGSIIFEGASNIYFAGMGYSPEYVKAGYPAGGSSVPGASAPQGGIVTTGYIEMYGDENIGLFFNTKISYMPDAWTGGENIGDAHGNATQEHKSPFIGIYQNPIKLQVKIGEKLSIDNPNTTQTDNGNLSTNAKYSKATVDSAVGVYAISGQREGIIPSAHLGMRWSGGDKYQNKFDTDTIHGLQIGNFDIKFGKYSKDGIMFLAKNGTVIDVAKQGSSTALIGSLSTEYSDGINGATTLEGDAATGTIIAYSAGTWDQNTHKLGTDDVLLTSDENIAKLQGKPTEINIYIPLTMTSKEGIAYLAEDSGIINIGTSTTPAKTTATGYESIIGYANTSGKVSIYGDIEAVDANVDNTKEASVAKKYGNIGAYAKDGGTIVVTGNAKINGIGALATGSGSSVTITGAASEINTGTSGGLVALNGSTVTFGGGTINHKDIKDKDHHDTMPFYADDTSKLKFTGETTVNVSDGFVFNGYKSEYTSGDGTTRYSGMGKVTVNLVENDLYLGLFKGATYTYASGDDLITAIVKDVTSVKDVTGNKETASIGLSDGTLTFNTDVDLNPNASGKSVVDRIIIEKENVEIGASGNVTSTEGKYLSVGSDSTATSTSQSGFTIKSGGKVNISGGSGSNVGLYTSFGHIDIDAGGSITVDNGAGAYGVNGSKITNNGDITLTGDGAGIAGLARRTEASGAVGTAENYGTDGGTITGAVVDITNNGKIEVKGTGAAIYANNNTGAARADVKVHNTKSISVGDNSAGIMIEGATDGGTLTIAKDTTATNDITVGDNSVGIYGENSDITITTTGNDYTISVGDTSVGLYTKGNSTINAGSIILNFDGSATGSAAALGHKGTGATATNSLNITVNDNKGTTGVVAGIYAEGTGTLTNNGNITTTTGGVYGISSDGVDIVNNGNISVGVASKGGVGLYANTASITTDGDKISIAGTGAVGIFAKTTDNTKTVTVSQGSSNMVVAGDGAKGIYVSGGKLVNNANIDISDSADKTTTRRVGIALDKSANATSSGDISVGKNNIGIYVNGATLAESGVLSVTNADDAENIGIYAQETSSDIKKTGTLTVNGIKNIGIYTTGGKVSLGGILSVTATSLTTGNVPVGIYGNGDNIAITLDNTANVTVTPNAVGVYLSGNGSTLTTDGTYSLSSDASEKVGVGAYIIDGASATGTVKVTSTNTQNKTGTTDPVRPIGIYYAGSSTTNGAHIEIVTGSQEVIGLYGSGLTGFSNTGNITLNAKGIGAYFKGSSVTNSGNVQALADASYGLFFSGGTSSSTNASTITVSGGTAIGAISSGTGTSYTHQGTINTSATTGDSIGMAAVGGGTGIIAGTINITNGAYGAVAKDTGSLMEINDGTVTETAHTSYGVGLIAVENGEIKLTNGSITMASDKGVAMYAKGAKATLAGGSITVAKEGVGIYAEGSTLTLDGTSIITLDEKGIGVYSKDNTIGSGGTITVSYNNSSGDKGVGIYYTGSNPVTSNVAIVHRGDNLVNIYSDGINLTNTGNLTINEDSIGIFADGGTISNVAALDVDGDGGVGIYLAGGSNLTDIGTITGGAPSTGESKVGVYVASGDITATSDYDFDIKAGIGIYLDSSSISYTGTVNVKADSVTNTERTIGIYVSGGVATANLDTNLNITGADAIGLYLDKDASGSAADITYNGNIAIKGTSTTLKGIGVYLAGDTSFTLGTTSQVSIEGDSNIGFYASTGSNLNVNGGTVINTESGIFAYLQDGTITFAAGSSPNINYANVIVDGSSGTITNNIDITVGTKGLHGTGGATITNNIGATVRASVDAAKAIIGTGAGTTITNDGAIVLAGNQSIGIYTEDNATATSAGSVTVGDKGVAYYAGKDGTITITGTGTVGNGGTLIYSLDGTVNYNTAGDITVAKDTTGITVAGATSTVNANKDINVSSNGTGVFVTKDGKYTGVVGLGTINVGDNAKGVYQNNTNAIVIANDINLTGNSSIGVLAINGTDITSTSAITGTGNNAKGIVSINDGKGGATNGVITNGADMSFAGLSSIGIFVDGATSITNNNTIAMGDGTSSAVSVAIYGKDTTAINNSGSLTLTEYGVGIYGTKSTITNSGAITNGMGNNTAIYGVDSTIVNNAGGNITLDDNSNGIYVSKGQITNNADITVGNNSSGLYGAGNVTIEHKAGTITVGTGSIGVAGDSGTVTVDAPIVAGTESTYVYSNTATIISNQDLTLSDYSVGIYTKDGIATNTKKIITGDSDIYATTPKISVGMATITGKITNASGAEINIPATATGSIGMYASGDKATGKYGEAVNEGKICVNGTSAYGMMATNQGIARNANGGYICVHGDGARGMVATDGGTVINEKGGIIDIESGAKSAGIYIDTNGKLENYGDININTATGYGVIQGAGGIIVNHGNININVAGAEDVKDETTSSTEVGDIDINGLNITIGDKTFTADVTSSVPELDFGTIQIGGSDPSGYIGTISTNAKVNGEFIVLSDAVKGANKDAYVIQYLQTANTPASGDITAISQSPMYLVDLQNDPTAAGGMRIVLVKVPFVTMTANTAAAEFGKGLDELYETAGVSAPGVKISSMFDSMKDVDSKDELARIFEEELRGNEYANIQDRIMDMREISARAVDDLRHSRLYSKDELKIGAIYTHSEANFGKVDILDYDINTYGVALLQEYDARTYGRNYGWNMTFVRNDFDYDNSNSREEVYALNLGADYSQIVGNHDALKWYANANIAANYHNMDRRITISGDTYENTSDYWSGMAVLTNKIRYEKGTAGGKVTGGIEATADLGYGRYFDITEKGDGMLLELPATDFYSIRPGVGADISYALHTKVGKIALTAKASYEYEFGDMYDDKGNEAKFVGTSSENWYLERPKNDDNIIKYGAELKYETRGGSSVGLEVVRRESRRDTTSYGLNFSYKF